MKKRYYAAVGIIAIATLLLLIGAPSWLAIGSLSAISIVLFFLSREEEAPIELLIELDYTDISLLSAIERGARSVNAIAKATNMSWDATSKRLERLEGLGLVVKANGDISLSSDASFLVQKLNSRFIERPSRLTESLQK